MPVIPRVLWLRHVLEQVNRITEGAKHRRPIGLARVLALFEVVGACDVCRDYPVTRHASRSNPGQGQCSPHGLSRITNLVMILALRIDHRARLQGPVHCARLNPNARDRKAGVVLRIEEMPHNPIEYTPGLVALQFWLGIRAIRDLIVILPYPATHDPASNRVGVRNHKSRVEDQPPKDGVLNASVTAHRKRGRHIKV